MNVMKFVDKDLQADFEKIPAEVKEKAKKRFLQRIEIAELIETILSITKKRK
jgi:hypothetical protein